MESKIYLGDSVYAEIEYAGAVKLTTENGYGPSNTIVLAASVLESLNRFFERYHEAMMAQREGKP